MTFNMGEEPGSEYLRLLGEPVNHATIELE